MRSSFVYILSNRKYGVLYVGFTNDLARRLHEHKSRSTPGFASDYGATRLVYVEEYPTALEGRSRERSLKRWRRAWKLKLVDDFNPTWRDLAEEIVS
jgi:putative endonuclease